MGQIQSVSEFIYPTVSLVNDDNNIIVKIIYKDSYIFIQSPNSENHIRLHIKNMSDIKIIIQEHARNYLLDNKNIYLISNFLPNRYIYTSNIEHISAFSQKLESLLYLMISVNIYKKI